VTHYAESAKVRALGLPSVPLELPSEETELKCYMNQRRGNCALSPLEMEMEEFAGFCLYL